MSGFAFVSTVPKFVAFVMWLISTKYVVCYQSFVVRSLIVHCRTETKNNKIKLIQNVVSIWMQQVVWWTAKKQRCEMKPVILFFRKYATVLSSLWKEPLVLISIKDSWVCSLHWCLFLSLLREQESRRFFWVFTSLMFLLHLFSRRKLLAACSCCGFDHK